MATVLLVGHGSRDPRSASTLRVLAERVRAMGHQRDVTRVELAFLEFSTPPLEDVLAGLRGEVVVVPLLLAEAFHARFDLPGRLAAAQQAHPELHVVTTPVLGPASLLDRAVATRTADLRQRGCDGVVLLGTGSSRRRANAEVEQVAARVEAMFGLPARASFVTRGTDLECAVADLRAEGAGRIGIVPWFLAPGRLLDAGIDQATQLAVTDIADPLATDPLLARLVLDRACAAAVFAHAA